MTWLLILTTSMVAPAQAPQPSQAEARQARHDQVLRSWLPAEFDSASPAAEHLQRGLAAFLMGDTLNAERHFGQAIASNSDLPPAPTLLGILCAVESTGGACHGFLDSAIRQAPTDPRTYLQYAGLELSLNHLGSLQALVAMADTLTPNAPFSEPYAAPYRLKLLRIRASLHEALGEWTKALATYDALHRLDVNDADYSIGAARMHYRMNNYEAATEHLAKPVVQKAHSIRPRVFLANWAHQDGAYELADKWLTEAIEADPNDAHLAFRRGTLLKELGRYAESAQEFDRASSLGYKDYAALELERAIIMFASEDYAAAERHIALVHSAAPDNTEISAFYALALVESKDPAKKALALTIAERNANRDGATFGDAGTLAWIRYQRDAVAEAQQAIAVAMRMPLDNTVYFQAVMLADQGQTAQAIRLLTPLTTKSGSFLYRQRARELHARLTAASAHQPVGN